MSFQTQVMKLAFFVTVYTPWQDSQMTYVHLSSIQLWVVCFHQHSTYVHNFIIIIVSLFIIILLFWVYIVTFTKVLTIYHSWIHPLHHSPLFSLFPIPGTVSTHLIFPFSDMSTWYLHHIHLLSPFPYILPLSGANPQTGPILPSCPTFLKTSDIFCLR
jgi:hypothetical protein